MTQNAEFRGYAALERRMQDLESHADHHLKLVSVVDNKFENGRWYVKTADKAPASSDDNPGGALTPPSQTPDAPDQDPNFASGWLPWITTSHAAISSVVPPKNRQRVQMATPFGKPEMATVGPFHNAPEEPLPSGNPDEIATQIRPAGQKVAPNIKKPPAGDATGTTHDHIANAKGVTHQVSSTDDQGNQKAPYVRHELDHEAKTTTTEKVTQQTQQTKINEAAQATMSRATGTSDPDKAEAGEGSSGGNLPHELNRQLQGLRAEVTQHTHHLAALHDQMSSIIDLAIPKVPQLAALLPTLNHQPQGLEMAADQVLGKLEQYVSFSLQQAMAKLTSSFMGSVMSVAGNTISSGIAQSLSQLSGLAAASDAASATANQLLAAQTIAVTLVPNVPGGSPSSPMTADLTALVTALQPIVLAFAGTPAGDDVTSITSSIAALSPATSAGLVTVNVAMTALAAIYVANAGPGSISPAISSSMAIAAELCADAFSIDTDALTVALAPVAPAFSGAAAQGRVITILSQIGGSAGAASGFLSGLSGLSDSQANLPKGMTQSHRLGGYGS